MKRFLILLFILVTVCSYAAMRGGAQYDPDAARRNLSNVVDAMTLTLSGLLTAGEASFGTTGTQFNSAGALVMPNNTAIGMKQAGGDIKTFGYMNPADQMQFGQSGQIAYFPGSSIIASGVINTATGTAAAPAYSFGSDPDTGIYSPGADSLGFSVAGAERLRLEGSTLTVDSSNSSNTNAVKIKGQASTALGHIGNFGNGTYYSNNYFYDGGQSQDSATYGNLNILLQAGTTNTSYMSFSVNDAGTAGNTERMRITSGGNVLIGTTTDDGANKLQVNGSVKYQTTAGAEVFGEITLADDESADINTLLKGTAANCGMFKVFLASNDGYGEFYLQGPVNDVSLISQRYAAKTDSDGNICVFSAGSSNYTLKNRLGSSATFIFSYVGRK